MNAATYPTAPFPLSLVPNVLRGASVAACLALAAGCSSEGGTPQVPEGVGGATASETEVAPAAAPIAPRVAEDDAPVGPPPMPVDPIPGLPYTLDGVGHAYARTTADFFGTPSPEAGAAIPGWRRQTRLELLGDLAGGYLAPEQHELDVRVLSTQTADGYRREEIAYFLEPMLRTRAYLYVPEAPGPHPAVVFWHGHNVGGHMASGGEPPYGNDTENDGARLLAEAGFVVLAPTIRSFHADRPAHAVFARVMTSLGEAPARLYTADAMRAVDVLAARDDVDASRIAATGVSLGGFISLLSAALDTRIAASSVHAFYPSYVGSLTRSLNCPCPYSSAITSRVDVADLGVLVAPRPLQVVAGRQDGEFPFEEQQAGFAVTAARAAAEGVDTTVFAGHDGGHEWRADAAIPWLREVLGAP